MYDLATIWLIVPMILIGLGAVLVLIMGTFKQVTDGMLYYTVLITLGLTLFELLLRLHAPYELAFGHSFIFDDQATMFKMLIIGLVTAVIIYSRATIETYKSQIAEFYSLVLLASMGMMLLVSASHIVTIFLGIELMSLPLYALVALYRDSKAATEAALKYFITGALSSGLLLFGFAWLYGATGSMELDTLASTITTADPAWLLTAAAFIVAGIAFKFGVAPFHMWVPDVYEAAPTPVTAIIATAPKVAMTALLLNIFQFVTIAALAKMLIVLAIISMLLGNIVALSQNNFKRMLAYSSVGHMGIILLAVANNSPTAAIIYIAIYGITTLLAFAVLLNIKINYQEIMAISELSGLAKDYPLSGFALLCAMFSMAGVPPLVGFMAKFMVLDVIITNQHYLWAIILVMSSVIGAVYYIRVIKTIYFKPANDPVIALSSIASKSLLALNVTLLIILGVQPDLMF